MADQKVSDLPSLTGADVDAADLLYIVDSSAGSAGSKKITVGQYQLAPVSGGTANGVAYLNASKALTTGSALVFDGTNLGIGTSLPGAKLEVASGKVLLSNTQSYAIKTSAGASCDVVTLTSGNVLQLGGGGGTNSIEFWNQGLQRMTLDSSGSLGIGTTSPGARLETVASGSAIYFSGGDSAGARRLQFNATTTTNTGDTQNINALGSTGVLAFSTNSTERARIDSSGNLLVGTTSNTGYDGSVISKSAADTNPLAVLNPSATNPYGIAIGFTGAAPNDATRTFLSCADNAATRATIRSNGGIANYQANDVNLSDRREKTNFAPAKSYLDTICAIPVQTFKYIDQTDDAPTLGVVAQDVQAVAPELVMESNWGTEDNPKMRLSIYQTDLQYALMKCIQEQQELIKDLRARVAALESA